MIKRFVCGTNGASEWTVGKMLSIILVIVLIVLVIYGVSSGALSPLIERLGKN